jgi:hypothetical protein
MDLEGDNDTSRQLLKRSDVLIISSELIVLAS